MHYKNNAISINKIAQSVKRIDFHILKHTSVSLMISTDIQIQIISQKAGHSSENTTHTIYSHFFDNEFKECANKMNDFLQVKSK